jgi:hypothetical protein
MLRVIIIDAQKKEVREETISADGHGLEGLQNIVGGLIEAAFRTDKDVLYVDEEGLLKAYNYGFSFIGAPQALYAGNGVMAGIGEDGETAACTESLEAVRSKVIFHSN